MKYISHYVFKLIHVSRSFVSFDLIHSILFVSFFFFKSLPVIILSLDQSSIDQSNGSSIDPSTFFFFISSLFICIVFFFCSITFLSFSLSILYTLVFLHLYLTSRRRPSLLKKNSFPLYSIVRFGFVLLCFLCFLPLALTRNSWSRFRPREIFLSYWIYRFKNAILWKLPIPVVRLLGLVRCRYSWISRACSNEYELILFVSF